MASSKKNSMDIQNVSSSSKVILGMTWVVMLMLLMGACMAGPAGAARHMSGRDLAGVGGGSTTTPATSSPGSCSPAVVLPQLRACGRYVAPNYVAPSNGVSPSDDCCNAIQNVDVGCLCQLLNNGPPISYLDKNKALALPQACNMNTTPSTCPNPNGN